MGSVMFAVANRNDRLGRRRLQQVRSRYSEDPYARLEAQMKKAVAARRSPALHGQGSRLGALALRLHRSGKTWSLQKYFAICGAVGFAAGSIALVQSNAILLSVLVGLLAGLGIPHWLLNRAIQRRTKLFNARFPDAIELLVRGLRSGLPVTETIGVAAHEVPGPVGEEFQAVIDRIKVGRTVDDSLQETANRLATPEFQFFCISLAIQRETGGNLAETLSNLADVLRKRAQMKLKVKAMSSEAKASAYILGSLPFIVFAMVYMVNPDYLGGFFMDDRLIIAGLGGGIWMALGAFIMFKMVSFEI
ncbi:type II secretion system F family protein [Croceicoccus sp. F390]|uniref:Type II secretion system F family protein n=1 Tax=Croceicoccus esteveae TaxID=3075597 RepID=A0ABU2ZGI0_9SPHN|nr:type II secretion system F family protein [Croceicoccus sp. F390]MDT0575695.1 type II secretion system F family protein [Croceicoccus sp. F390]